MAVGQCPHGDELVTHHPELIQGETFEDGCSVGDQRPIEGADALQTWFRELHEYLATVAIVAPSPHEALAL